jgi:hypothetical protein
MEGIMSNVEPELQQFIDKVYREPYSVLNNNCFRKSIKIVKKARELGKEANLVLCWTIVHHNMLGGFPTIQPHMYAEVEGQTVDVAFDPDGEKRHCKNNEQIVMLPIKLPNLDS